MFKYVVERVAFVGSESLLESMHCVRILLKCIWIIFLILLEHYFGHFYECVELTGDFEWVLFVENLVLIVLLFRKFLLCVEILVVDKCAYMSEIGGKYLSGCLRQ